MSFLILQNSKNQTARVIPFGNDSLEVIYRFDSKRIEIVRDTKELEESEIDFKNIASIEKNSKPGVLTKGAWGQIKLVDSVDDIQMDAEEREEKDLRDFPFFLKWTSGIEVAVLAIVFAIGWYISTHQNEEQQIVKVFQRPKPEQRQVVELSKRKLKDVVVRHAKKVAKTPPKKYVHLSTKKQKGNNIRSGNQLKQIGALSALGGFDKNSKGLGGLSQAKSKSMGYGFDSNRAAGGNSRGLLGKGLIQSGIGSSEKMSGYGGYGTNGKGSGQAGYGAVKLAGQSGGYYLPLSDEAIIEGGLDPEQVEAVIQRNRGQLTYCYEKALQSKPNLSGRTAVDFVISPSGHVSVARVSHTSTRSPQVDACIVDKLRGLKFPKPKGNVSVKVNYPFLFKRTGQS